MKNKKDNTTKIRKIYDVLNVLDCIGVLEKSKLKEKEKVVSNGSNKVIITSTSFLSSLSHHHYHHIIIITMSSYFSCSYLPHVSLLCILDLLIDACKGLFSQRKFSDSVVMGLCFPFRPSECLCKSTSTCCRRPSH